MAKKIEGKKVERREPTKCSICMERNAYASITCSHQFCMQCIGRWVKVTIYFTQRNQTCPLCREEIHQIKFGKRIKQVEVENKKRPILVPNPTQTRPQLTWKTLIFVGVPMFNYYYPANTFFQPMFQ